jgi:hypothetical protein
MISFSCLVNTGYCSSAGSFQVWTAGLGMPFVYFLQMATQKKEPEIVPMP